MLFLNVALILQSLPASFEIRSAVYAISKLPALFTADIYDCAHDYTVEILSLDPLILYINNFLSEFEIRHLLQQSDDKFESSFVYNENLESVSIPTFRSSQSAMLSRTDAIGLCLSQRLKSLLGNIQHIGTEQIQIVKYEPSEKFNVHMDWFEKPNNMTYNHKMPNRPYNRLVSIFAYLYDGCTGGETYFPRVQGVSSLADGEKFSRTESGRGLLVRPKRGNAVFWNNLLPNGSGNPRVAHAGLPVHEGTKIGINLFSHYYYDAPMIGGDEE